MSVYTMQVRWIIESQYEKHKPPITENSPNTQNVSMTQKIQIAAPYIFDFDFPIQNENHRLELETKILRHYFSKEIGLETVTLWKFYLETRLNEIMPYYNILYNSADLNYNILDDMDTTEIYTGGGNKTDVNNQTTSGSGNKNDITTQDMTGGGDKSDTNNQTVSSTASSDANATNNSNTLNSDTPQANYTNPPLDYANNLAKSNGTSVSHGETTGTNTTNSTFTDNFHNNQTTNTNYTNNYHDDRSTNTNFTDNYHDEHTIKRTGRTGARSVAEMIKAYRDNILNIDMMIINDLSDLFMKIY